MAFVERKQNAHRILVGNREGILGRPLLRLEDNIKMNLKGIG